MWVRSASRRDLIEIIQADRLDDRTQSLFARFDFTSTATVSRPADPEVMLLIWREDPREHLALPNAIITPTDQRDFFAWAVTYLNALRPLTAYMRIASHEVADRALKLQPNQTFRRLERACAGLILGEAATYLDSKRELKQLPIRVCASTCSFVMARAFALGFQTGDLKDVLDAWFEARDLTRQSVLPLGRAALEAPWRVAQALEDGSWRRGTDSDQFLRPIFDTCLSLYLKGELDLQLFRAFEPQIPSIAHLVDMVRGPREDRVLAVERAVHEVRGDRHSGSILEAFVVGCLASQIAPGTLDHLELLLPYTHEFAGLLMWYGLCAGLQRRSAVDSYAGGLGRRVLRDALRNDTFLDRPSCDIALSELQVAYAKGNGSLDFRTSSNAQIDIELAPCVVGTFGWPPKSDRQEPIQSPVVTGEELYYLQLDLDNAVDHLHRISSRLASFGTGPEKRPGRGDRKARRK